MNPLKKAFLYTATALTLIGTGCKKIAGDEFQPTTTVTPGQKGDPKMSHQDMPIQNLTFMKAATSDELLGIKYKPVNGAEVTKLVSTDMGVVFKQAPTTPGDAVEASETKYPTSPKDELYFTAKNGKKYYLINNKLAVPDTLILMFQATSTLGLQQATGGSAINTLTADEARGMTNRVAAKAKTGFGIANN